MRSRVAIAVLVFASQLQAAQSRSNQFVQGTVVDVQKYRVESPTYAMGGSNRSDAPLTTRFYAFDISIRVGCATYVGRYDSAVNYLPMVFSSNRAIQLHLTKQVMYFDLPNDPDTRLGIVRRKKDCGPTP